MTRHVALVLLVLLPALSCGNGVSGIATFDEACAIVPDCLATGTVVELEPLAWVLATRAADGAVTFANVRAISVEASRGVPAGPSGGTHLLAGLDATGAPVNGQWLSFPVTALLEGRDEHAVVELEGAISAVGYVRLTPEVVDLALLDADEAVLARAPLPPPNEEEEDDVATEGSAAGLRQALNRRIGTSCAHIHILAGNHERHLIRGAAEESAPIVPPGPAQRAVLQAAMNLAGEHFCSGTARIVLADYLGTPQWQSRGFQAAWTGDLIQLNVGYVEDGIRVFSEEELAGSPVRRAQFLRLVLHEMGHAFAALLETRGDVSSGQWTAAGRNHGLSVRRFARVTRDFGAHWGTMHQSFVDAGFAEPYAATRERGAYSAEQVVSTGAMNHYGSTQIGDDICEVAAWTLTRRHFDRIGVTRTARHVREDYACEAMNDYTEGDLPARFASIYTKLWLLHDLGVLSEAAVRDCTGPHVGLRPSAPGFTFLQDGTVLRHHRDDPSRPNASASRLSLRASGFIEFDGLRRAFTEIDVPGHAGFVEGWPRGIFALNTSLASFTVTVPDEPAANLIGTVGYILIARANTNQRDGSLFLTRAFRPDAPVPVPQGFDPPLVVRFHDNHPLPLD